MYGVTQLGKALQERAMSSGQSAEIRESGRHGGFDLFERRGSAAQSTPALL